MATIHAPAPTAPATLADKPVFIPASRRKALAHADVPAMVARYIVGADDALIRPSSIRQSVAALKTAMGGAPNIESFINGLAGIAARLAWGAIKAESAADGLPDFARWAVFQADAGIISRKGISAGLLRALVADVITRTAALPVRTAPAKSDKGRTLPAPAPVADAAPAAPAAVDRAAAAAELARMVRAVADAPINTRDAIPHDLADAETADAHAALAAADAAAAAERAAAAAARAAADAAAESAALARMTAAGQAARLRAHAFATLANELGIKLTKAQLARLDEIEKADATPAAAVA